jgi:hypothetical protein
MGCGKLPFVDQKWFCISDLIGLLASYHYTCHIKMEVARWGLPSKATHVAI